MRTLKLFFAIVATLAGCGGGGSGSNQNQPPNPPPVGVLSTTASPILRIVSSQPLSFSSVPSSRRA